MDNGIDDGRKDGLLHPYLHGTFQITRPQSSASAINSNAGMTLESTWRPFAMSTASRMACLCIGTEPVFAIIGDAEQLKLFVCRWPERVFSVKLRIPLCPTEIRVDRGPRK